MISRRLLRVKVLKVVFSALSTDTPNVENAQKELQHSLHKTYELYHYFLSLAEVLRDVAQQQLELGKQKQRPTDEERNPNTKFANNQFITVLQQNAALRQFCEKHRLNWHSSLDIVKKIYATLVQKEWYHAYMKEESPSCVEDKNLLIKIYEELLEDFDPLLAHLEEQSLYWVDDVEFALSQVLKTLRSIKPQQGSNISLMPMFVNQDDEQFGQRLLSATLLRSNEFRAVIDENTKNWDVERIAFMDIIIMTTAIAELLEFENIPIRVTLNEYIEISKYYSTPSSSTFINGVLDRTVEYLKTKSSLQKQ
ncbi:MAG: transcription antitermination factor NusB [Bacteroidales bacterium]